MVDGLLDEDAWKNAEPAKDFFMVSPMDTSFAKVLTEVRMSYDKDNLYISAICYQPNADLMRFNRLDVILPIPKMII